MITTSNYFEEIRKINLADLPEPLRKSHDLVKQVTSEGASWNNYANNPTIKRVVDLYLQKLNDLVAKQDPQEDPVLLKSGQTVWFKDDGKIVEGEVRFNYRDEGGMVDLRYYPGGSRIAKIVKRSFDNVFTEKPASAELEEVRKANPERVLVVRPGHGAKEEVPNYKLITDNIKNFVPAAQLEIIGNGMRGEEKDFFRDKLVELDKLISEMPVTYGQDKVPAKDKIVYLHYFTGSANWYIVEKDKGAPGEDGKQHQAFGYADLGHGDGEWGYISIEELRGMKMVELDLHFKPQKFSKVVNMKKESVSPGAKKSLKAERTKPKEYELKEVPDKWARGLLDEAMDKAKIKYRTVHYGGKKVTTFIFESEAAKDKAFTIYKELLAHKSTPKKKQKATKPASTGKEKATPVERLDEEHRIVRRFVALHGKEKTAEQVMNFLDYVQKAILEKRVRKESSLANEVMYIQKELVKIYNKMISGKLPVLKLSLSEQELTKYGNIARSQFAMSSIQLLKRYVSWDGKKITKEKAQKLKDQLDLAVKKGKITRNDPYAEEANQAWKNLRDYIQTYKRGNSLKIYEAELHGVFTILQKAGQGIKYVAGKAAPHVKRAAAASGKFLKEKGTKAAKATAAAAKKFYHEKAAPAAKKAARASAEYLRTKGREAARKAVEAGKSTAHHVRQKLKTELQKEKAAKVIREFYKHKLYSNGELVMDIAQAKAIAMNTARGMAGTGETENEKLIDELVMLNDAWHDFSQDHGEIENATKALFEDVTGKPYKHKFDNGWNHFKKAWKVILKKAKSLSEEESAKIRKDWKDDLDFAREVAEDSSMGDAALSGFIENIIVGMVAGGAAGAVQAVAAKKIKPLAGVMSIAEAKAAQYKTIGLEGKWKALIGEACMPFYLFVYGPGGSGKSSMILQFVDYLAQHGHKIGYVAGEQYNTPTFAKLLNMLNITDNGNLIIVEDLTKIKPADFEFVVLDSKDSLGINIEAFRAMKKKYPGTSYIITSQSKKDGDFTGGGNWQNEVDTMIRCESGIATTVDEKNRWGGHADMPIFGNHS